MTPNMHLELLISEDKIRKRVSELAGQIASDYKGVTPTLIGVLNGSFMFLADLIRELNKSQLSLYVDFIRAASYGAGTVSSGAPEISLPNSLPVRNRPILLVDDILDTGFTFQAIRNEISRQYPSDIKSCVCLDKPARRKVNIEADYVGFTVPDTFVVGYGLDYDGQFRELSAVSVLSFS
jgi:hypoxanthine phosphoribosyltransferase